jgi:hypothetical protein
MVHVNEVRLRLWTATASGPIVRLLGLCSPTFCDLRANLYNAANLAGHKQNKK